MKNILNNDWMGDNLVDNFTINTTYRNALNDIEEYFINNHISDKDVYTCHATTFTINLLERNTILNIFELMSKNPYISEDLAKSRYGFVDSLYIHLPTFGSIHYYHEEIHNKDAEDNRIIIELNNYKEIIINLTL